MYTIKFKKVNPNLWRSMIAVVCAAVLMYSCGDDDHKNSYDTTVYKPNEPSDVTSYYPEDGKFQEKVMISGVNLPNDPSMIRVYFNQRRAPIIGTTGKRMYVMAPRLPGKYSDVPSSYPTLPRPTMGYCKISVVILNENGAVKDSIAMDGLFTYEESITVTTIAGNGSQTDFQEGNLSNAILQPKYVCCDLEGNIFITNWRDDDNRDYCYFCRLNEEENIFTRCSATKGETNIPACDPNTGVISVSTEATVGSFNTLNPAEYWAPRMREMKFVNYKPHASQGWKHSMVVNPTDGFLYTRWYHGGIVRINQTTLEAWVIAESVQGDSYGLTFRAGEPNIMYMSFRDNAGTLARSIATVDVSAGDAFADEDPNYAKGGVAREAVNATIKLRSSSATGGGHRDGALGVAQFSSLGQLFADADGFIYVADRDNHCIRRITPENQVETVLGFPGTPGWKDGTRDEALFRKPMGVAIDKIGTVYIADCGNSRLRKLSVN